MEVTDWASKTAFQDNRTEPTGLLDKNLALSISLWVRLEEGVGCSFAASPHMDVSRGLGLQVTGTNDTFRCWLGMTL